MLTHFRVVIVLDFVVLRNCNGPIGGSSPANVPPVPAPVQSSYLSAAPRGPTAPHQSLYAQAHQPVQPSFSAPPQPSSLYGQSAVAGIYGGYANRQPVVRTDAGLNVIPISALNPYMNKWAFKARITNKSEIRSWSNAKGSGTLFSIDLLDAQGTEIKGTFFKDQCDKFYPVLEQGKVYVFSGGRINPIKDKRWSTLKNDYEITFDAGTTIEPAVESNDIKSQRYSFVKIGNIANMEVNAVVDILGLLRSVGEVQDLVAKTTGRAMKKRDIVLTDDSGFDIRLTLWDDKALIDLQSDSIIIAVKGCKVGDYQGRTLSTSKSSTLQINPDIDEAHELFRWREQHGGALPEAQSMSSGGLDRGQDGIEKRKNLSAITDEGLGLSEKPDYVTVKATVTFIKHDQDEGPWYTACPSEGCNKKVIQSLGDTWQCEKCGREYGHCNRRYILSLSVADHTCTTWVTLFDDAAKQLLGHSAEDLHQMKLSGDDAGYEKVFSDALFKEVVLKLRVKQEMVNDEPRIKSSVTNFASVDFVSESKQLLSVIAKYD